MAISNLLDQLTNEHNEVKKLFKKAGDCKYYKRSDFFQQIKEELIPHARGEEKTIYSLLKERLDARHASEENITLANEAYEEHRVVDNLIKELESVPTYDETWPAHLKVLKENVEHHIKEEENELFQLIKEHFTNEELMELLPLYMTAKDTYSETLPAQSQINERRPSAAAQSL